MSINLRKVFPMFVLMFLLKGGLNQIMFLFLFRFFGRSGLNSGSAVCPEVLSTFSYSVLALLKISSCLYFNFKPDLLENSYYVLSYSVSCQSIAIS